MRKEHRWTYGIMITVLLAAMALLAGVLKDFKTELASIGKAQAGIEARQEIILKRIKPLQLNRFDPKADLPILDIYGASDAFTLPGDAYPEDGARDYYNTTMPGKGADLRLIWPPEKY